MLVLALNDFALELPLQALATLAALAAVGVLGVSGLTLPTLAHVLRPETLHSELAKSESDGDLWLNPGDVPRDRAQEVSARRSANARSATAHSREGRKIATQTA